jgi:hypothetical protein
MSRAAKKKDPVVPADTSARPPPGVSADKARAAFAGLSKGRSIGFSSSNAAGPPLQMPSVATAAAARTPAAPQGPEIAPSTARDDVTAAKPTPAAPPPAAAAPPAAAPVQPPASAPAVSATSHRWAVPGVEQDARAESTNAWADRVDQRSEYQRRRLSEQIPQGETQLVHVWFSVLAQGVPPQACTIWLTRSEPEPPYQLMISGDAVAGAQPDRMLFKWAERNRRQAGVAESFVGRIRAPTVDGKVIELGGGMLHLPPDPAVTQPQQAGMPPWMMAPGAQWTPGQNPQGQWGTPPWMGGGGMGGMPPWWMMPPWMMGQHGNTPPWWGPSGQQMQIPDALKGKPELVALLEAFGKMQHQPGDPNTQLLMGKLIEHAFKDKPVEKQPGMVDQVEAFAKLAAALDAIRGDKADASGGITVTYVDDGAGGRTPIVSKGGDIDMSTTVGIPAVGALRSIGKTIGQRFTGANGAAANRGKSPTAQVPASTTTTTTTNGTGKA